MNNTINPLFRASFKFPHQKEAQEGTIRATEAHAATDCREAVAKGATFAAILRDSQGADHPDNAGHFFLHRYVKA